ncbi:MAG TPA: DNA-binding response regulator, partial [Cytophagales bacterium]|nr:DNA-binding response regulator [Cytophagales bacterium]
PLRTALSYGVRGYVLKNATQDVLVEAITQVAGGGNYFHQPIQDQMLAYFRGKKEAGAALSNLSERELEIIKEIAVGGSSVDIAERLHL